MTSSNFDTEKHQQYYAALKQFRSALLSGEKFVLSIWRNEYKINSNTLRALKDIKAVGYLGTKLVWTYKNDCGTNELDNKLVSDTINKLRDITKGYDKANAEKKKKDKKITTAIKSTNELQYHTLEHQIIFINGELEKEKQVKGYLRSEHLNFFKTIKNNLTKFKEFRELLRDEI